MLQWLLWSMVARAAPGTQAGQAGPQVLGLGEDSGRTAVTCGSNEGLGLWVSGLREADWKERRQRGRHREPVVLEQIFVCLVRTDGRKEQVGGTFEKMKQCGWGAAQFWGWG